MPSYYNRINGTLEVAKLAKSSDIHLIQSSIQDAISNVIVDLFGPSFVLGEAENDLTLVPTDIHIDQLNMNCDEEDQWLSFYERYFRQPLFIEKSSIESITLDMINDSNITTTVYAEIRDINYNLLKESNAKLAPTQSDEYQQVTFTFDLHHLGVGRYYFILKPIDISAADLALNGDESSYDTIVPEMFCVRYDRDGNYEAGLEASYNGVDYLEAYMLEDELEYEDGSATVTHDTNFDLYFRHTFSTGNTYLISPGAAIVHGQKVYPIDTHVTIAGPSPLGDRTDLVVLTQEGFLKVIQGTVYNGAIKRPRSDTGLKIAYITSYKTENADWICPNCHTSNDGNSSVCYNCGSTINTKIPLIEQADDNGMTRQRDVLERLRRLEKMMAYEQEYNRPTRVKYMCTNDPIIFQSADNLNNAFIDADSAYGMTTQMVNGELINVPSSASQSESHAWAIRQDPYDYYYQAGYNITEPGNLYVWDQINYDTKPTDGVTLGHNISIRLEKNNGHGIEGIPIDVKITGKGNKFQQTLNTNKNGNIRINPYVSLNWAVGTYKIEVTHNGRTATATYKIIKKTSKTKDVGMNLNVLDMDRYNQKVVSSTGVTLDKTGQQLISQTILIGTHVDYSSKKIINYSTTNKDDATNAKALFDVLKKSFTKYTIKRHGVNLDIITGQVEGKTFSNRVVPEGVITGPDSFYFDNAYADYEKGAFKIAQVNNRDDEYTTNTLMRDENPSGKTEIVYKVNNNIKEMQSDYPVLDFHYQGGYIHSLTPYIKKFKNIESFQIILFENEFTFGQTDNQRISYQKKIENDEKFPNVYVSPRVEIANISRTDAQGNRVLNSEYKFIVDKDIPKGNYSLLVYAKLAEGYEEGAVFIEEYTAMSQTDKYGISTRVKGTCNPALIYLETNGVTNRTWDLLREERSNQYKATGIVISKPITVNETGYKIRSVKLDYNNSIPDGCDMKIQVSNDAGRNWVTARNNIVTFSGYGTIFEWKIVMRSNGTDTPLLTFDKERGYALKITLNTITDGFVPYEDYGRCLPTPVMDFAAMTYKVFGDSTITQADFSEWEWARLFMEDDNRLNEIQILISNGNTDNNPIYTSTYIDDWNRNLFFHQAICGLTLDDFEHTSIDYSNYDPTVEHDEYNFRFKYDTEYGETIGSGETLGTYKNTMKFQNYPTIAAKMTQFSVENKSDIKYVYQGNAGDIKKQYSGTHLISGPYYGTKYNGPDGVSADKIYYNSDDDPMYDRQAVIVGMLFENGLKIDDKYTDLILDIFVSMGTTDDRPKDNDKERYVYDGNGNPIARKDSNDEKIYLDEAKTTFEYDTVQGVNYFPANTFELVVSLNEYGLMGDDMTYGKKYDIGKLYDGTHNQISVPLLDDFIGSTIYSIGIRVKDVSDTSTLRKEDIIALGDLKLGGHDRRLYWPSTKRYGWNKGGADAYGGTKQRSYASIVTYFNGVGKDILFPLTPLDNANCYDYDGGDRTDVRKIVSTSSREGETNTLDEGTKAQTMFTERRGGGLGAPVYYHHSSDPNQNYVIDNRGNRVYPKDVHLVDNTLTVYAKKDNGEIATEEVTKANGEKQVRNVQHETYLEFPEFMFTFLDEPVVNEPSFYIDVDFNLDPYTWVRIEHWLESEIIDTPSNSDIYNLTSSGLTYNTEVASGVYTQTQGMLHSGDIVVEFYDTRDHTSNNVEPVETFALPAWGRIQTRAKRYDKEVNAWFKIRNGGRIQRIVIKRKNPTGDNAWYPLKLHLYDIGFHREKTVPALGSQLQMRIYPKSEATDENTSIRKVGVVYRIA